MSDAILDTVPDGAIVLARDGPEAFKFWRSDASGVAEQRLASLECKVSWKGGSLAIKTVGSGITLEAYGAVASALVGTTFTEAELAAIPAGAVVQARWREGSPKKVLLVMKVQFK